MKRIAPVVVTFAVVLAACAAVRPVDGRMERSDETFTGRITGSGYREGSGDLTLVSSRGTTCRGSFVYTSRRRGEGTLRCDDGRSGPFHVAGVNEEGNGAGDLSGQRFTFRFGNG